MPSRSQCPACASCNVAPHGAESRGAWRLYSCGDCRLVFTHPWPSDEQLAAAYREEYYGTRSRRFRPLLERVVRCFRGVRARKLARFHAPGDVLDLGCGRGWTLAALRERGWRVRGVELNDDAARHAREALGIEVDVGDLETLRHEPRSFDAVVLWHVLEHLRSPRATLAEIARLLRPGGVLALAVPNRASWQARWFGPAWFHLDLPRHLWHFSPDDLARLLDETGFEIRRRSTLSWEQNPFGWLQSLLNAAGLEPNLLYDLIRRDGARRTARPWRTHPVGSCLSCLALATLLPAALLLTLTAGLVGRGGTIELYAVRRDDAH